jgi:hypothetical protein
MSEPRRFRRRGSSHSSRLMPHYNSNRSAVHRPACKNPTGKE